MKLFIVLSLLCWQRVLSLATEPSKSRRKYFGETAFGLAIASGVPAPANAEVVETVTSKIKSVFPGALSNDALLDRVAFRLIRQGFQKDTTLVASSLCADEVNRPLEETFRSFYGDNYFAMGGLAGFPFSGVTGFGAMASHIPDGGKCLLVYGPHVGVDSSGNVGKVDRRGKIKSGTCCGSSVAASKYLTKVISGEEELSLTGPIGALDAQQSFVSTMLLPYASEIANSKEPMVTLPFAAFRPIDNMMTRIVGKMSGKVGPMGKIAMLGGLQVSCGQGQVPSFVSCMLHVAD